MNSPHSPGHDPAPGAEPGPELEHGLEPGLEQLARHASERLRASAEGLDARTRSRLTQARHAALAQAGQADPLARWLGLGGLQRGWQRWMPAGALAASLLLAALLVLRVPGAGQPPQAVGSLEDAELLADADGLALAQESNQDLNQESDPAADGAFDFYAWAVDADAQDAGAAVGS
jgi:hypothetical protein